MLPSRHTAHRPFARLAAPVPARACAAFAANPAISAKFVYWRGRSGRRYLHTVFPIDDCPELDHGVFLAVATGAHGRLVVLDAGCFARTPGGARHGTALGEARRRGADRVHVHLLADTRAERAAILEDLRAALLPASATTGPVSNAA